MATQQQITGQRANAGMRIYYRGGWWDIQNTGRPGTAEQLYSFFFHRAAMRACSNPSDAMELRLYPEKKDFPLGFNPT